jgi:FKBP-type peptidyl-prolyl cis-trans isomerase FklB
MTKPLSLCCGLLLLAAGAVHAQQPAAQPAAGAKPESLNDRASYIIGLNLGRSLKTQEVPVSTDLIIQGLRDGLAAGQVLLSDEEIQATMQDFQKEMLAKQQAKAKAAGEKNTKEGEEYLAKNKARKEVTTTASGLQHEVLKEGTGPSPKPTDQVTVHYKGTLIDGTVFDSSYDRNEPATFAVNQVIPGWVEALQLMKQGGKSRVVIPAGLAYGESGAGPTIGPNSTLIFEIELLNVGAASQAAPDQSAPGGAAVDEHGHAAHPGETAGQQPPPAEVKPPQQP